MSQQVILQNPQQTFGYNDLQQQLQEPEEIALQRLNSEEERSERRRIRRLFDQVRIKKSKFHNRINFEQKKKVRLHNQFCLFTQNYEMTNRQMNGLSHIHFTYSHACRVKCEVYASTLYSTSTRT